jgi:hypothetical protein
MSVPDETTQIQPQSDQERPYIGLFDLVAGGKVLSEVERRSLARHVVGVRKFFSDHFKEGGNSIVSDDAFANKQTD